MKTKLHTLFCFFSLFLFFQVHGQNCISDLIVEQDDCTPFGEYNAFVSFEHSSDVDSVSIYFNGNFFGNHATEFQPIVLSPIAYNPTGNNTHIIEVTSTIDTSCNDVVVFNGFCELGNNDCLAEIFSVDTYCIDSTLQFELGYTFLNPVTEGHIYVNDEFISNATLGENQSLTFSVNINPDSVYEVVLRDAEFPSCGDTLTTQVVPCVENCAADFDISSSCNLNGTYNVNFFHQDTVMTKLYHNDVFISRIIPGQTNNSFLIEGLPIDTSRTDFTLTSCLVSSPSCCRTVTFDQPNCALCDINLNLNEIICEGFAPAFNISYDYLNPASTAQFIVNGSIVQNALPGANNTITLNPQILNEQGLYTIILQDTLNLACADTILITDFFCDDCIVETSNIMTECIAGTENYVVELDIFNTGSTPVFEYFIAHQTGLSFGPFNTIGANGAVRATFEIANNLQGQFQVFDANGICTAFFDTQVDCNPNTDCSITNLLFDLNCLDSISFEAFIQFESSNVNGNTVEIIDIFGQSYGLFDVNQQPISIIIDSPQEMNIFGVSIINPMDSNCVAESNILEIPCDTCQLESFPEFTECIPGSTNYLLGLNISNNGSTPVLEYSLVHDASGEIFGPFTNTNSSSLTFLEIEIPINLQGSFTVINEATNCTASVIVEVDCDFEPNCSISNIDLEYECLDENNFQVFITFNHQGIEGDTVVVRDVNGNTIGFYDVNQQPIIVDINSTISNINSFGVFIENPLNPECSAGSSLIEVDCITTEPCEVTFIEILDTECHSDGTYTLSVNYNINIQSAREITVNVNGINYDVIPNPNFVFMIEGITPRSNSEEDIITICSQEFPDCCLVNEYQQPNCMVDEECIIDDIEYEPICLDTVGFFMVNLFFTHENASDEVVITEFNGTVVGQFDINEQPISVGPFSTDDLDDNGIGLIICDAQIQGCCAEVFVDNIPCNITNETCEVEFIEVISTDCNADGTYNLNATYSIANGDNDFIDVIVNGGAVQSLSNSGSVLVTDITPRSNSDFDIIEICLNDNPNCCEVIEYLQPNCNTAPQECEIEIVSVDFECDGSDQEQILFQLDVQSNSMNSFLVFVNGVELGTGLFSDVITEVGPFPQNSDGFYSIQVIDADDSTCRAEFELFQAFCPEDCFIGDLEVEIECLNNGYFSAAISFPYEANHQDGVRIVGNGTNYGLFDGFDQPIILDSLLTSANDVWEFVVTDNQDDACQSIAELSDIGCTDDELECIIENIEVFNLECIGDNEYAMSFSFETGTNANVLFSFFVNGESMNAATTSTLPLNVFGVIPNDSTDVDIITICLDDFDGQCCVDFAYEQPACLSNSVDATLIDAVSMSPNPTSNMLYIKDIPNDIIGLHVIDNLGRTVNQIASQQNIALNVSEYQNGIYTIQFFTQDNIMMSRRFVKM